jgi:hypothetical protein
VKAIRKIAELGHDRASEIKLKAALAETANRHTQENRHLFSKVNFETTIPETKNLVVKRSWYLSSWEDTFDKVIKQQTTKKTIPGNEHCFDIPKKKYELTLASELYQNAYALSSKKLPIIREVLLSDQLVFNDKDHVFSLKDRRHGKKVIKALKLLGIEDNQVVVFYDQKQINDSSLPDLAEFLDVAHKSLRPKAVNFKNHSVGGEYLSLRIRRVHSKKIKQQTNMHNYGLNFFIRLLKLGSVR